MPIIVKIRIYEAKTKIRSTTLASARQRLSWSLSDFAKTLDNKPRATFS